MTILFIFSILILFVFAITNGMHDGSNIAATAISSGSLSRGQAIGIVFLGELLGPLILGSAVAMTIANNILTRELIVPGDVNSMVLIVGGILGALVWNTVSWKLRLPSSSSFSLIGGLTGPFIFAHGLHAIQWKNILLIVMLPMFLSPIIGIFSGFIINNVSTGVLSRAHVKLNNTIKKSQFLTLFVLGANHGSNDSQKIMGIMILLFGVATGGFPEGIPLWIKLISISGITIGVTLGGTKIIKTVGYSIFKMRPRYALESQVTASTVLLASNLLGLPVSTTQIVSSSVIGVGSAVNRKLVRWQLFKKIIMSWFFTLPVSAAFGAGAYFVLSKLV